MGIYYNGFVLHKYVPTVHAVYGRRLCTAVYIVHLHQFFFFFAYYITGNFIQLMMKYIIFFNFLLLSYDY